MWHVYNTVTYILQGHDDKTFEGSKSRSMSCIFASYNAYSIEAAVSEKSSDIPDSISKFLHSAIPAFQLLLNLFHDCYVVVGAAVTRRKERESRTSDLDRC